MERLPLRTVPLHHSDGHYTTFITPWGRKTAPQGYIASGDGYTSRYDALDSHIQQKTKCIDYTLLWADNIEEAYTQAVEWLDLCGRHSITLNPTKFHFTKDKVEFAGFEITELSVKPCRKYLRASPDPTDVRSWFGLINQIAFTFSMTDTMAPFRDLLKPTVKFEWTEQHESGQTRRRCRDLRQIKTNQPGNRLVKGGDRLLVVPEAL